MIHKKLSAVLVCLVAAGIPLFAQQRVDPRNTYEQVLAVVPMVGSGNSTDDPIRPLYAPRPSAMNPTSREGVLAYTSVLSDDGRLALVEFVAADRSAFKDILGDPAIKAFLKGRDKAEDVLAEFRKHKKDFDFAHFGVRMP